MAAVHVLGNAAVDLLLRLPRLARTGETAVASAARRAPGGKGLNQAVAAARAGARTRFCAPVGRDADADFLAAMLGREGLAGLHLLPKPCPTDQSIVMVAEGGENSIVSLCGCADELSDAEAAGFAALGGPQDWLLLQGNLTASATLAAARAARGQVMVNAAPLRWAVPPLLTLCSVVVVNHGEAADITGNGDAEAAAAHLVAGGCATAIVTLGSAGCLWADKGGPSRQPAVMASGAVDSSGAGDVFCGVAVAHLAAGAPLQAAIAAAQAAAALSVTRRGAYDAIPTPAELQPQPGARQTPIASAPRGN